MPSRSARPWPCRLPARESDWIVPNPDLKVYSHALGSSAQAGYAPAVLLAAARRGFLRPLAKVPVPLPTAESAVRARLDPN